MPFLSVQLFLVLFLCGPSAIAAEWQTHARRFTGESARVRESAISALRKDKQLPEKLKKALGTVDHFLALDVISVLKLRSFMPILNRFSERDRTGYSYHVLNSILQASDLPEYAKLYRVRLSQEKAAPAAKIALLDALGRMNVQLERDELDPVMKHADPEVRSAGLYYVRTALLKWRRYEYLPWIGKGLGDPALQLRLQTLYLISEIPRSAPHESRLTVRKSLNACREDPASNVRSFCAALLKRYSQGES